MAIPQLVLLPRPRRIVQQECLHRLQADRLVWLAGEPDEALLDVGRAVRDAVNTLGSDWQLTAFGAGDPRRLGAVVQIEPRLVGPAQGYRLAIDPEQIRLVAHDTAGAFYGAMTFRQIARQCRDGGLPCLRIEDHPDFAHRGVMLDISRDRVPTMATLRDLVDLLAEWKVNQLQLYTENTFAYREHREVWEGWSPITGEEAMELDAWCRARHIELVPNQNAFGHMARWLVHPRYRHLCEDPDPQRHFPQSGLYGTLCPLDEGSIDLVRGLFDELLPHFSSRQLNVGCDEARIGIVRSKEAVSRHGKGRVYLDYVLRIHDLVQRRGRTMQFWGDVLMHFPELVRQIPADAIPLVYDYAAEPKFEPHLRTASEAGVPCYVAPGTSTWASIAGRTDVARSNLGSAARAGIDGGAIGYLNTDWGDRGHWQHLPISFAGYAYGAAVSWAHAANHDLDLARALDVHAFQDAAGAMGRLACDLGNAHQVLGVGGPYGTLPACILFNEPGLRGPLVALQREHVDRLAGHVQQIMAALPRARMARPDGPLIAAEFANAAALIRHACHLWSARLDALGPATAQVPAERTDPARNIWPQRALDAEFAEAGFAPATRRALIEELEQILAEYRRLWLARNRPGGLSDSAGRFEHLLAAYRAR